MSTDHRGSDDCLHCIILRLILDRAKKRRAEGIDHDTIEDVAKVTEVLGQLVGTMVPANDREELYDVVLEMLEDIYQRTVVKTEIIMAERAAEAATKH